MTTDLELKELAQSALTGLERYARRGRGQALDALIFAAAAAGVDTRAALPRRLTALRRAGLIPHYKSTRASAVRESIDRAQAAMRTGVNEYLST